MAIDAEHYGCLCRECAEMLERQNHSPAALLAKIAQLERIIEIKNDEIKLERESADNWRERAMELYTKGKGE